MDSYSAARDLSDNYQPNGNNEADTRHQIIDVVLHDILSWPRDLVKCEENVVEGYMDYALYSRDKKCSLIIEAKNEDIG